MRVEQTQEQFFIPASPAARPGRRWRIWPRRIPRALKLVLAFFFVFCVIGRNEFSAIEQTDHAIETNIRAWHFDIAGWTFDAWRDKAWALTSRPAHGIAPEEAAGLVHTYLERAERMWTVEEEINVLLSADRASDVTSLQQELDSLRLLQETDRPAVEAIIENQVSWALVSADIDIADLPMPPVLFTFTEPPRKLVVSPRYEIATVYAAILDAEMSLEEIERSEDAIYQEQGLSAYVTNIGGLGVFPTMVMDRASLGWVLSTVAHEWAHNYLTFFPLGASYSRSSELTIINESVATIVGDELGLDALHNFYPDLAPPPEPPASQRLEYEVDPGEDPAATDKAHNHVFDFRKEMRATRLHVDELLAQGLVEEAEAYMEERRQQFVSNGYPLRVLNQAYFAFHGSYVDSPSSTSPIGPKLERLRALAPDLKTFLETVRWFTSEADLDAALAEFDTSTVWRKYLRRK